MHHVTQFPIIISGLFLDAISVDWLHSRVGPLNRIFNFAMPSTGHIYPPSSRSMGVSKQCPSNSPYCDSMRIVTRLNSNNEYLTPDLCDNHKILPQNIASPTVTGMFNHQKTSHVYSQRPRYWVAKKNRFHCSYAYPHNSSITGYRTDTIDASNKGVLYAHFMRSNYGSRCLSISTNSSSERIMFRFDVIGFSGSILPLECVKHTQDSFMIEKNFKLFGSPLGCTSRPSIR